MPKEAAGYNGNGVAFALILAHQDGAGLKAAVQAVRRSATRLLTIQLLSTLGCEKKTSPAGRVWLAFIHQLR